MRWPRGHQLYDGSFLCAHRTTPVDGQPTEVWTVSERFRDARFADMLADAGAFIAQHHWPSLPRLVEANDDELVVSGAPWVGLRAIQTGALPAGFVLAFVRDLARDLAEAPTDVILRSISPKTLAVTTAGTPRLLDLALARYPRRRAQTGPGVVKGEIDFMSPENVMAGKLESRSDIFSLGLVAFEMLAGERAVRRGTDMERIQRIFRGELELEPLRDSQPAPIAQLVERMLVRDADARISAAELVAIIETQLAAWTPAQVFDEVRRRAPEAVDAAILYGI